MLPRPTVIVSLTLFGSLVLARWVPAQGSPPRGHAARITDLPRSVAVVLDGIVLEPDGSPAAGAVVVSSAGGEAVTGFDGRYRLEVQVPLEARSVQLTAVGAGSNRVVAGSVGLAAAGTTLVDPLVLALGTECGARWLPTFGGQPGVFGSIIALAVFDDGSGAALYAGGYFTDAGGVPANNVARWNGSGWSAVGSGVDNGVHALAVFDDGSGAALYAGGSFSYAGDVAASSIAKWDGASWSAVGGGMSNTVYALTVFDDGGGPALHAGGVFTTAGGVAASRIAKWDGASWSALGSGVNNSTFALEVWDDGSGSALYAGGGFTSAGGVAAIRIAKWDGASWSALGSGVDNTLFSLAVFDDGSGPALYAGGAFTTAGGAAANHVAKWDASSWSPLAGGMNGFVYALAVFDGGGGPELIGATDGGPHHIAKWNGSSWSPMHGGMNDSVRALAIFDGGGGATLYAGGVFTTAGGVGVNGFAKWDGEDWSGFGTGLNGPVTALATFDGGGVRELFVGGDFSTAGGVGPSRVARWDGSTWSALGSGMDRSVEALAVFDDGSGPALYAGGWFTTAGGAPASNIARWDGTSWAPLGSGMSFGIYTDHRVNALAVFDDGNGAALYAGGAFSSAGGVPAKSIARWNGSSWSKLGGGIEQGVVFALAVFDDGGGPALYAAGSFFRAGGLAATCIAKWDGAGWSAVGGGMSDAPYPDLAVVHDLEVFDDGSGPALYAGGEFLYSGAVRTNGIAKWDGSSWSALGSGFDVEGAYETAYCLATFDDGGGPALYAGGRFLVAGGVAVTNVARWDGASWSALGSGTSGGYGYFGLPTSVEALANFQAGNGPALYVGGDFGSVPDSGDSFLARWSPFPCTLQHKVRRR